MIMTEVEKVNEKCNKLKALVIKEKKINVENRKLLDELQKKYEDSQNENTKLSEQIQRLTMSIGELQSTQTHDVSTIECRYEKEIEALKQEICDRKSDYDGTLKSKQEEMELIIDKLMRANACIDENAMTNETLMTQKQELISSLHDKDTRIESLKTANEEIGKSLLNLERKLHDNSDECALKLDESKKIIAELEFSLHSATIEAESKQSLQTEIDELREQNIIHNNVVNSLNNEIKDLKDTILELDRAKTASEIDIMEERKHLASKLSQSEMLIETLNAKIHKFKSSGKYEAEETEKLSENPQMSQEEIVKATDQIIDQLTIKDEEIETLRKNICCLEKLVEEKEAIVQTKEDTIKEVQLSLEETKMKMDKFENRELVDKTEEYIGTENPNEQEGSDKYKRHVRCQVHDLSSELYNLFRLNELDNDLENDSGKCICNEIMAAVASLKNEYDRLNKTVTGNELDHHETQRLYTENLDSDSTKEKSKTDTLIHDILIDWVDGDRDFEKISSKIDLLECQSDLNKLMLQVNERIAMIKELELSNSVLEDGIQRMTSKCSQLEEVVTDKDNELTCLRSQLHEATEKLDEIESDVSIRDDQVEQLQAMVEDTRNIVRALEREKDALQSEIMELTSRSEEKENILSEEVRELKSSVNAKENNIHELRMSIEALRSNETSLVSTVNELENKCAEVTQFSKKLEDLNRSLELELANMKERMTEIEDRALSDDSSNQRQIVNSQEMEILDLRKALEEMRIEIKTKDDTINIQRLHLQEQVCDNHRCQLHTNANTSENETTYSETENAQLMQSVDEYTDRDLKVQNSDCKKETGPLLQFDCNEKDRRAQIELLEEERSFLVSQNKELSATVESLTMKYNNAKVESETLLENLEVARSALSMEREHNSILKSELEEIKSSFQSLEEEVERRGRVTEETLAQNDDTSQSRKHQLDIDKQAADEKILKMKQIIKKLKRELVDASRDKEESVTALQNTIITLHEKQASLEEVTSKERIQFEQALKNIRETSDNENSALRAQIIVLEQELTVLRSQRQQLMAERLDAEEKLSNERFSWKEERESLRQEVECKMHQLKEMREGLERAELEGRQRSVMDLELAEFERTVESLKDQLDAKEERIAANEEELQAKMRQIRSLEIQVHELEGQKNQADERGNKLKQMVMKMKREVAEARKKEEEYRSRSAGLSIETESKTTELEECKLQLANSSADQQNLEDQINQLRERLKKQQSSQETSIRNLKSQIKLLQDEKSCVVNEFETYKAKAQAAFRREKEGTAISSGSLYAAKDEVAVTAVRQRLEAVIERLKSRLEEVETHLETSNNEQEILQREYDRLTEKLKAMENEIKSKESQWNQRLVRISQENTVTESEHLSALHHLTQENEIILRSYKEQLRECRSEHAAELNTLRSQIELGEIENERLRELCLRLQQQYNQLQEQMHTLEQTVTQRDSSFQIHDRQWSNETENWSTNATVTSSEAVNIHGPNFVSTHSIGQRMQAEGMEQPSEDVQRSDKMVHSRNSSYVSFEQLLNQPSNSDITNISNNVVRAAKTADTEISDVQSITSVATDATIESYHAEVMRSHKQCEHLSQLLEDSESMVQHLTEQANVLKNEIRRYELNTTREKHTSNAEYLKNVIMKFLTIGAVQERRQLVPVIATVLSLTKEEKDILLQVAEIRTNTSGDPAQTGQGWSSYFHWAGLT